MTTRDSKELRSMVGNGWGWQKIVKNVKKEPMRMGTME